MPTKYFICIKFVDIHDYHACEYSHCNLFHLHYINLPTVAAIIM